MEEISRRSSRTRTRLRIPDTAKNLLPFAITQILKIHKHTLLSGYFHSKQLFLSVRMARCYLKKKEDDTINLDKM